MLEGRWVKSRRVPPLRRPALLLLTLLALGTPCAAVAQEVPGVDDLPPVTTTPGGEETTPDPPPEPEPAPEPEPEPAPEEPAPEPRRELANTGAEPAGVALLGGAMLLLGVGLRLRTAPLP